MTALMGTTGAGKTTLMDLLACRKNSESSGAGPTMLPACLRTCTIIGTISTFGALEHACGLSNAALVLRMHSNAMKIAEDLVSLSVYAAGLQLSLPGQLH